MEQGEQVIRPQESKITTKDLQAQIKEVVKEPEKGTGGGSSMINNEHEETNDKVKTKTIRA